MKTRNRGSRQPATPGTPSIPYISLFSGVGGLDLGLKKAGFEAVLAVDASPAAVRTFNHNFARDSISDVAVRAELEPPGLKELPLLLDMLESRDRPEPRGVVGGPPCQGFSRGNAGSNPDDPRNHLIHAFVEAVKIAQDRYSIDFFILENVPGLAGAKHAERLARVEADLTKLGYSVFQRRLDAKDYGVPQCRQRLFIVGFANNLNIKSFQWPRARRKAKVVRDVINGLPEPAFFRRGIETSEIPHHPNHWTMKPRSPKFSGTHQFSSSSRSFKLLDWDQPSKTVAYGNREIHVHPDGRRRLSIYEAMRLQGFPDTVELLGSLSEQVQQVSNAVPPPLASAIGRSVKRQLGNLDRSYLR